MISAGNPETNQRRIIRWQTQLSMQRYFQPELDAAAVEQATSGWMEVNRDLAGKRGDGGENTQCRHGRAGGL